MVRAQAHTEARTQLAMKGLYTVPLTKLEQVAGWIAGNPATTKLPQLAKTRDFTGAADKALNLAGCTSLHHQLHAEATKHVQLGRTNLSCISISRRGSRR